MAHNANPGHVFALDELMRRTLWVHVWAAMGLLVLFVAGIAVYLVAYPPAGRTGMAYGLAAGMAFTAALAISAILIASLCRTLKRHVTDPLEDLIERTVALNTGADAGAHARTASGPSTVQLARLTDEMARLHATLQQQRDALRASEARYLGLTQAVPVGLCRSTMRGQIVDANPAMADILGFPDTESLLACEPDTLWADPKDRRLTRDAVERQGVLQGREVRARRRDGEVIWLSLSGRAVVGEDGVKHFDVMVEDITERKRAELELQQYRNELEELVAIRTSELASATKQAKVADRAKRTFLSNMSHELRTPLTAIMGYGQILMKTPGLPQVHKNGLKTIVSSGEQMLALIEDLLDLSRIEAGKLAVHPGEVELPAFLHGVVEIMQLKAAQRDLTLVCDMPPGLPPMVYLDAIRLRQVLLSLLGNAIKFTDRGQVSLRVRPVTSDAERARLRFEVHDTGTGIAPEHLASIFEPFEQVGPERQRCGGLGLGLTISRELVKLMGGIICVESTQGMGSVFWFEVVTRSVAAGSQVDSGVADELQRDDFAGALPHHPAEAPRDDFNAAA